jgi:DNA-binding NarL/FixJ family response regulator
MDHVIRLLLADDHALVREGLKHLFSFTNDIVVAAEAFNGAQVLDLLHQHSFDVVLLDLTMPGLSGPDLVACVCKQENVPPVLVLSMHAEPQIVRRALAAGATGYLTKDNNPDLLLTAIRKVAGGTRFLDPVLAQAMAFEAVQPHGERPPHEILSEREMQIFSLLARGLGINEIADQLSISNKTVSTHKSRLMEKMHLATNADLVKYAIFHKLVD